MFFRVSLTFQYFVKTQRSMTANVKKDWLTKYELGKEMSRQRVIQGPRLFTIYKKNPEISVGM